MADLVKMKAKTTFHNNRIHGGVNGVVSDGDTFETDLNHARDLARMGHAEPLSGSIHDLEAAPLEAHYTVSEAALRADRERRAGEAGVLTGGEQQPRTDGPTVEQYVAAGYKAESYPPQGFASRSTSEEIAAAIRAQTPEDGLDALTVSSLRELAAAEQVELGEAKAKAELVAAIRAKRSAPAA